MKAFYLDGHLVEMSRETKLIIGFECRAGNIHPIGKTRRNLNHAMLKKRLARSSRNAWASRYPPAR